MLSDKDLIEFALAFNKYIETKNIKPIIVTVAPVYIYAQLQDGFNKLGGLSESLVAEIDKLVRPIGPAKDTQWLSNFDIMNAMSKYEKDNPDFQFFGAVPLDCESYGFCPLKSVDFNQAHKIGIIYNLDRYGQKGSHWVALYADVDKCEIYFSDSAGKPPRPNIQSFIDRFIAHCGNKAVYKYNTKAYQKDDTECGVYSINFIVRLLNGDKYEDIIKTAPTFEQINSCRNVYFANQTSKYVSGYKCE